MAPFSEVLINRLNDLEVSFKVLAKRLAEASELLQSLGRPLPQELLRELANSAEEFEEIKAEVLKLSESVAGLPPAPELGSIRDLRSFMDSVSDVIEKQTAHRDIQQAAGDVLDKVLAITHADGVEFSPLIKCQEKARQLRGSIAATAWPDVHPDADALARGVHMFSEFVKLVSFHDSLDDEEWGRLQDLVSHSLGKPLGLAASRGKLIMSTSVPPPPQARVSVEQEAAATDPKEEMVLANETAAGEVAAVRIEDHGEGLHGADISAPAHLSADPPSQMPPVMGGEAVTDLDHIDASGRLASDPVRLSNSIGATSMDQFRFSPAPEPLASLTTDTTFQGTLDDIKCMLSLGFIGNKGMAKVLSSKISAASDAAAGGDNKTAQDHLNAFINEVRAKTGKYISGVAPQLLLADASSLLGQLQ